MPTIPLYHVDSFADQPFTGNPAGVCLLDQPRPEAWMQSLAAELKHAETAFLLPEGDGYSLRWFTPEVEVDLCGHATLASAHILFETGRLPAGAEARFQTRSGLLTAKQAGGWIELNFPATVTRPAPAPAGLLEALGIAQPLAVQKNDADYLIELAEENEVRALQPDFRALKALPARGVIVTARGSGPYDFVSRFFAPPVGIDEDPVTGSAHCSLAPYWSAKLGKDSFTAFQASARGGIVRPRLEEGRVILAGRAITIYEAALYVSAQGILTPAPTKIGQPSPG